MNVTDLSNGPIWMTLQWRIFWRIIVTGFSRNKNSTCFSLAESSSDKSYVRAQISKIYINSLLKKTVSQNGCLSIWKSERAFWLINYLWYYFGIHFLKSAKSYWCLLGGFLSTLSKMYVNFTVHGSLFPFSCFSLHCPLRFILQGWSEKACGRSWWGISREKFRYHSHKNNCPG